jgi:hypothetical protein
VRPPVVRKEWTEKQARAAQRRFEARGGKRFGARRPYAQWRALQELDALEQRFLAGDRYALALALRDCAAHALPMPDWVADAYIRGFDAVHTYQADSWEQLFGPVIPKGKHLLKLRREFEQSIAVYLEVQRRHEQGGREPIDDALFESVGEKFDLGKTTVAKYYVEEKRRMDAMQRALAQPGNPIGELLRPFRRK